MLLYLKDCGWINTDNILLTIITSVKECVWSKSYIFHMRLGILLQSPGTPVLMGKWWKRITLRAREVLLKNESKTCRTKQFLSFHPTNLAWLNLGHFTVVCHFVISVETLQSMQLFFDMFSWRYFAAETYLIHFVSKYRIYNESAAMIFYQYLLLKIT